MKAIHELVNDPENTTIVDQFHVKYLSISHSDDSHFPKEFPLKSSKWTLRAEFPRYTFFERNEDL